MHTSNDEQFYDDISSDIKYVPWLLENILMLFTSSLLTTSWIKNTTSTETTRTSEIYR